MDKINRSESGRIGNAARKLANLLNELANKYFDEDDWGPSSDLYAKDYQALLSLQNEINFWIN